MRLHLNDSMFLEKLYLENYDSVYRLTAYLLKRGVQTSADAADVTQEVFVIAAKKIDEVRRHPKPVGWLYKTAFNCCRNHIQACARHKNQLFGSLDLQRAEADSFPLSNLLISLEQTLSKEDYELIRAYYVDERPLEEICARTGLTPNALRVRIHRIKKSLCTFLLFLVIFSMTNNI